VGSPHHWPSLTWSDDQWDAWLSDIRRHRWTIRHDGQVAGIAEIEIQPHAAVEIVTFGLVPEFVGAGFGGHALTLVTYAAWEVRSPGCEDVRRVWLHTSTLDHPHALPNYLHRGFRPFDIAVREHSSDDR
jgi:RimJ/RimL family protein N-acetyltransferase